MAEAGRPIMQQRLTVLQSFQSFKVRGEKFNRLLRTREDGSSSRNKKYSFVGTYNIVKMSQIV